MNELSNRIRKRIFAYSLFCMYGTLVSCDLGYAAITSVGDVTPTIPLDGVLMDTTLVVAGVDDGSVTIQGGSTLTAEIGTIALNELSSGYVEVTGPGSQLLFDEYIHLGKTGYGELAIRNGGTATSRTAQIGAGTARLIVEGTDSFFATTHPAPYRAFVALNASIDISDGGKASTGKSYFGSSVTGFGMAKVSGLGSEWKTGGLELANHSSVIINNGGHLNSDWITLGTNRDSNSTLEVTDPGSILTANLVFGGSTSSSSGIPSTTEAFIRKGATWNGAVGMGNNSAVVSRLTIEDPGTTWHFDGATIGAHASADLTIRNGAKAYGGPVTLGTFREATGRVIVEGAGTEWHVGARSNTPGSGLSLGLYGKGELTIRDGALVTSEVTLLGELVRTSARVSVIGAGSVFDHGSLVISDRGQDSHLELLDGAKAMGSFVTIGNDYGGRGSASIQGLDSTWNIEYLSIAARSNNRGEVRVDSGGVLEADLLILGAGSRSTAVLEVDGVNSAVNVAGILDVGSYGNYTSSKLAISNLATVSSMAGQVGGVLSDPATVEIDGAGSKWNISDELKIGKGAGGLQHLPPNTVKLSSGGKITVGRTVELAHGSSISVDATSSALVGGLDQPVDPGTILLSTEGTLTGRGMVTGDVHNDGLVSPATSFGRLEIEGDYRQSTFGSLLFSLGEASRESRTTSDLFVDGIANLSGTFEVVLEEDFEPQLGDVYRLVESTHPIEGGFDRNHLPRLPGLLGWSIQTMPNSLSLAIVEVPEPASYVLLAFAVVSFRLMVSRE